MTLTLLLLYGVFVILNLADGITTWIFVHPDNYHREANPLARWIFTKLGITRGIILAEVLWIGVISAIFFLSWQRSGCILPLFGALCFGVGLFTDLVLGNIIFCKKLGDQKKNLNPHHNHAQETG
jgi:hypothetical protein